VTGLTPGELDEVTALESVEAMVHQQVLDGWEYRHRTAQCHLAQTVFEREGQKEDSMTLLVVYSLAQN
jgi:hypothetical protein